MKKKNDPPSARLPEEHQLFPAAQRLHQWAQGQNAGPWKLLIFPTYRCNITCGICVRDYWERNPSLWNELPDERWLEIIDEAAALGVRRLTIGGGGEPTVRHELVRQLCIRIKEHGMEGFLQTNGTKLTPELIDALITTRWDHITISLDGPDAVTNDTVRSEGIYDTVVEALLNLKNAREKAGSPLPEVALHTIITATNYRRLPDMVDFARNHGVDMLAASPLLEEGMEDTPYILSPEQRKEIPAILENSIALAEAANIKHTMHGLAELYKENQAVPDASLCTAKTAHTDITEAPCLEPWIGATVFSNGHVSPCCYFMEEKDNSLRDQSFEDLWFGPYFTAFRKQMLSTEIPPYCKDCHYPGTQEHQDCRKCLKDMPAYYEEAQLKVYQLPRKFLAGLRAYGLRGGYRRFLEWRSIRRSIRRSR